MVSYDIFSDGRTAADAKASAATFHELFDRLRLNAGQAFDKSDPKIPAAPGYLAKQILHPDVNKLALLDEDETTLLSIHSHLLALLI